MLPMIQYQMFCDFFQVVLIFLFFDCLFVVLLLLFFFNFEMFRLYVTYHRVRCVNFFTSLSAI